MKTRDELNREIGKSILSLHRYMICAVIFIAILQIAKVDNRIVHNITLGIGVIIILKVGYDEFRNVFPRKDKAQKVYDEALKEFGEERFKSLLSYAQRIDLTMRTMKAWEGREEPSYDSSAMMTVHECFTEELMPLLEVHLHNYVVERSKFMRLIDQMAQERGADVKESSMMKELLTKLPEHGSGFMAKEPC